MSEQTKCPTCGQSVRISVSGEGTGCFLSDKTDYRAIAVELAECIEHLNADIEDRYGPRPKVRDLLARYRELVGEDCL